jgi:hypothetical protein
MNTQDRLRESDLLWFDWVVPTLRDRFPGEWRTEIGTDRDMKDGIDYTYTENGKELTVSARLWKSRPAQHFALRWKRTKYPEMPLEIDSRLHAIHNGGEISDLTMEGFLYSGKLWIAIIDTHRLYSAIDGLVPFLSEFTVENTGPKDLTIFKRASWDLFQDKEIERIILPLQNEPLSHR